MAFSSALAMRVLSRSEISGAEAEFSPPDGGAQSAPRAWMSHFESKKPPEPPPLTELIHLSVVDLCQSSAIGRARIWTQSSSPESSPSLARVPVIPARGSTSKLSKVLMGSAESSVRVSSAE